MSRSHCRTENLDSNVHLRTTAVNRKNKTFKTRETSFFKMHDAQCVISNQGDLSLRAVEFESGLVCIFLTTIKERIYDFLNSLI